MTKMLKQLQGQTVEISVYAILYRIGFETKYILVVYLMYSNSSLAPCLHTVRSEEL